MTTYNMKLNHKQHSNSDVTKSCAWLQGGATSGRAASNEKSFKCEIICKQYKSVVSKLGT